MLRFINASAAIAMVLIMVCAAAGITIDHNDTEITGLSLNAINLAKDCLHIGYGHTSHGSQVTDGMTGLNTFINGGGLGTSFPTDTFRWVDSSSPPSGTLDLDNYFVDGDLGNPDRTTWAARTRSYLNNSANKDVNVIMWSWCGQADTSAANIDLYLNTMNQLEIDYPKVSFIYMTGHVNGCSTTGNLFYRNQQIRDYCTANDKILYDFADIESWDPDGNYYGDKLVSDECWYDSDGNGSRDKNWALDWQNASEHVEDVDWFDCSCAHSQPLNGNQKAYAAWSLWTEIAESLPHIGGDANGDGRVDDSDAARLAANWLSNSAGWADGDFSGDGLVDDADATLLAANWQTGLPSASVPEPALAVLLISVLVSVTVVLKPRRAIY